MKLFEFQAKLQEQHDARVRQKALSKLDAKIQKQIDAYLAHQKALPEDQRVSAAGVARAIEGITAKNINAFNAKFNRRNQKGQQESRT